jgi:Transglutaminase-like superfamily
VQQLAKDIVGTATQSSEKVQRIRQWMTQNVAYNLTAKDPGNGADPIDYLLFTSKEGSCTHFATATAALLRSVGVPTRISTGFVAQERSTVSQFVVRGRDAHAWAEVPLKDGDWLQVDTTIGAREVFPSSSSNGARFAAVVALLVAIGVLLVVGVRAVLRIRQRRTTPASRLFAADLVRLAHRLNLAVPPDCSTATLARLVDRQLATQPLRPGNRSELQMADQATKQAAQHTTPQQELQSGTEAWPVGSLGAFGQQLEAATFGSVPVDLSAGSQIFKSAFRRARSQRWEKRRLRLPYRVR